MAASGCLTARPWRLLGDSFDLTLMAYWNPRLSGHIQARLPPVASHRHHGHEPYLILGKVRKRDVVSRVLTSLLAVWRLTRTR